MAIKNESSLSDAYKKYLSFAEEKLADLKKITADHTPAEVPVIQVSHGCSVLVHRYLQEFKL